jgi:predicted ATPase/DNA-binding CsgD family transcriptional regulator/tetratricopeptide (TPR) repeat protein
MALATRQGQVTGSRLVGLPPAEPTSFVGRTIELAGIAALLRTSRMVTVTGPAGVGKTRTSLVAAAGAAGRYRDGVCFADLSAAEPGELAGAVAAALGVPGKDHEERAAALPGHLCDRRLLLVLDTCEHLVDAAAGLADTLLRAAPGVTLLATSRQPLDAQGEHAYPLPPLPAEADAVDLFTQRAAAVVPGFAVTAQNRAAVVRLCRLLDGIPLAIELAAVRLRALPLGELTRQLESGIKTLTVSRRGTTPRHQTLSAAVEWSYRLCTPAEQELWQRLSVFAGTFDVDGAEQVCPGGPLTRDQVLPALVGLVDKSVVLREGSDAPRYRLPNAPREFGADRLADADGTERLLRRLAAWSLGLARDFDKRFRTGNGAAPAGLAGGLVPGLAGPGPRWPAPPLALPPSSGPSSGQPSSGQPLPGWPFAGGPASPLHDSSPVHQEYENVAAALEWALGPRDGAPAHPEPATVARWRLGADLAAALCRYWRLSGRFDDGRRWLGRLVSLFPDSAPEHAWALGVRGEFGALQGQPAVALADITEAARLAAASGQLPGPEAASGSLRLSLVLGLAGQQAAALAAAETVRLQAGRGRRPVLLAAEVQLAQLHLLAGRAEEAIARCERALALLATPPGPRVEAAALTAHERWLAGYLWLISGLALLQRAGGAPASARALRQALVTGLEFGDVPATAYAVEGLAWLATRRAQHERAAGLLGAADQLWERTGKRLSGVARLEESRQAAMADCRQALGERRYAAAYARGSSWPAEGVLRDTAEEPAEPPAVASAPATDDGAQARAGRAVPDDAATAGLTKREREIADLVASGLSNREIATRLFISKRTVDAHVDHIFSKLEISSRVQLTVLLRDPSARPYVAGTRGPARKVG